MAAETVIAQWGNSLGLRIPKKTAESVGLEVGDAVRIEASEDMVCITKVKKRPEYSLQELLDQVTDENKHAPVEWGDPKGREIL